MNHIKGKGNPSMKAKTKEPAIETNEAKGMLQYIPVKDIFPHPDNPRKDLGDLTELTASIQENGILQNLTIVPRAGVECMAPAGQYTVLIGHRRLAAAYQAGLSQVPCVVVSMTIPEQIQTMLMENMQRMDLTLFEQANGFQMMLDLGGSIKDVAGATGFSETTIKRRIKLLDLNLDAAKLKATVARNVSIQDYLELEKVESLKTRNRLLEVIGTNQFENQLRSALYDETQARNAAKWIELLSGFAKQVKTDKGYKLLAYIPVSSKTESYQIPKDHQETKYFFCVEDKYGVRLLIKGDDNSAQAILDREKAEREARKAALAEVTNRAYELRRGFARDFSPFQIKVHEKAITEAFVKNTVHGGWTSLDRKTLAFVSGIDMDKYGNAKPETMQQFMKLYQESPSRGLWLVAYSCMEMPEAAYYDYSLMFKTNERLNNLYDLLESLGYSISDEEAALMKGTFEQFRADADFEEMQAEYCGDDYAEDEDASDELPEDEG